VDDDVPASRPPPWLPLLRTLTELSPSWAVWKNADRAIAVSGDIDSVSAPADRDTLLHAFSHWASLHAMSPVFVCRHLPGSVLGVAVRDRRELIELQLCERAMFRGSTLFTVRELSPLMVMDDRGFRRLRPGSEGLLLLFHNGMGRAGRPSLAGEKAKRSLELMRADPGGVHAATAVFGSAEEHARRVAEAALEGRWERGSALRVETWAMARALTEPRLLASRVIYRATGGRYCALLPLLRRGRKLHGDVDAWLERATRTHPSGQPPEVAIVP
jgi:hypothetical protein